MNMFKSGKEMEKSLMKPPKSSLQRNLSPRRPSSRDRKRKFKDELDHYKLRALQLRDESNALYQDLIALKRDKSEVYGTFARENNEVLMQMIYEINRAEDEVCLLEQEVDLAEEDNEKAHHKSEKKSSRQDDAQSTMDRDVLRVQQEEARAALKGLKEIIMQLKGQLASLHNYVSALHLDCTHEKHGDQAQGNNADVKKKERMNKYESLLKELGIRSH